MSTAPLNAALIGIIIIIIIIIINNIIIIIIIISRYLLFSRYVLQRRQGHDSGFHSLIAILKLSIDSLFLKLFGRLSHILVLKT